MRTWGLGHAGAGSGFLRQNIASFCNSVAMEEELLDFVLFLDAVVLGAV